MVGPQTQIDLIMSDLEKLALQRIVQMSREIDQMLTTTALKIHHGKEPLKAESDIYPIGSKVRDLGDWAQSILKSK